MKAKSIKVKTVEEIKLQLEKRKEDGFVPTLAIVFSSIKLDNNSISKLFNENNITVFGASTADEFRGRYFTSDSTAIYGAFFSKSPSGDSCLPEEQVGVKISVMDNGNGIPPSIKDKIFQPFFTTKPTGSETGLGLSLSYDIVKAHGGEIKVESTENTGTEFIITLPV